MSNAKSLLLKLPAELKDRIYRYALHDHNELYEIPEQIPRCPAPPLLMTCQQIRQEALEAYYLENLFYYEVAKDNADTLPNIPLRILKKLKGLGRIEICTPPDHNWPNRLEWLRRIHAGDRERFIFEAETDQCGYDGDVEEKLCRAACQLAYDFADLPWNRIAQQLERIHLALAAAHFSWQ